jgi:hypothetical protein
MGHIKVTGWTLGHRLLLSLFCTVCTTLNVVNTNLASLPYGNEDLWKVGLPMQDTSLCVPLWLGFRDELALLLYVERRLMRAELTVCSTRLVDAESMMELEPRY